MFFPLKVDPLSLESQNQAKNIPVTLLRSTIKIDPGVFELRSDKERKKHRLQHWYRQMLKFKTLKKVLFRYILRDQYFSHKKKHFAK